MKAKEVNFLNLLHNSSRFIIPIYQRTYSWTKEQCGDLWGGILRAGEGARIPTYFIGAIVCIEKGTSLASRHSPFLVIDGQQRLTTVSLILEALARHTPAGKEPIDGFSPEQLRHDYLLNSFQKGDDKYKLTLTQTDKKTLYAIIENKPLTGELSIQLKENFEFFEAKIKKLSNSDLVSLCRGLEKLVVVDVVLDNNDNPQLIFESMNSTGLDLSQADLIRNFVLMGLKDEEDQSRLYEDQWQPMEIEFGQKAYRNNFDRFMRDYLTVRTGDIPRQSDVYSAFKNHFHQAQDNGDTVDDIVADVRAFAGYYCAIALGKEEHPELKSAFSDLRELKAEVTYPFVLKLYEEYAAKNLSAADFCKLVRWVESYVFRRAVCGIPTNSHNNTFAEFTQPMKHLADSSDKNIVEEFQSRFLLLPSYRRFPKDNEFRRELQHRDLYNFRNRNYWLRRLENHGRKELVSLTDYTVEHIMPQNETPSEAWRKMLGDDWKEVQGTHLHKLGNLTLTGYNSEYSDKIFAEKRDMEGGFKESPLKLNADLGQHEDDWNQSAIEARGRKLASRAIEVWVYPPELTQDILAKYQKPKPSKESGYSVDDHPHLAAGMPTRALFDRLREEIKAIDPCVAEEFLKVKVAYKAETNFVDVVALNRGLKLTLNLDFHELRAPRKVARDVSNIGTWGSGNVEVSLESEEDIPYIMGLVRQAFDKQMDNPPALGI